MIKYTSENKVLFSRRSLCRKRSCAVSQAYLRVTSIPSCHKQIDVQSILHDFRRFQTNVISDPYFQNRLNTILGVFSYVLLLIYLSVLKGGNPENLMGPSHSYGPMPELWYLKIRRIPHAVTPKGRRTFC